MIDWGDVEIFEHEATGHFGTSVRSHREARSKVAWKGTSDHVAAAHWAALAIRDAKTISQ